MLAAFPNGAELAGWLEYLARDDERQQQRLIAAIIRAFNGPDKTTTAGGRGRPGVDEDGEPIIDTTDSTFAKDFQGFIGGPAGRQPVTRPGASSKNTDILFG